MGADRRTWIAARAAAELRDGDIVNLGIGIPTLIPDLVTGRNVVFQSENGMLGFGPRPTADTYDADIIDAGKQPVTERAGVAYFDSASSFGMIRGGHVDVAVIGALQVDGRGRVANWAVPGKPVLGVGGAMDLLAGARRVVVAMTHTTRDSQPKVVETATLPLTSLRPVDLIITDLAVLAVDGDGLRLVELAPGVTLDEVHAHTTARLRTGSEAAAR
jgi:3-oxoacid CoA-transferase subunit B